MNKSCSNCAHRKKLILWEGKDGRYLPNYDKPKTCCVVLLELGCDVVYGHTEQHDGMCEMWSEVEK